MPNRYPFTADAMHWERAKEYATDKGFVWDDSDWKMLYLLPSREIPSMGRGCLGFLWQPWRGYTHVSFETDGGYTIVGAHLTIAAGDDLKEADNRIFFCNQDRTAITLHDLLEFRDMDNLLLNTLNSVMVMTNNRTSVRDFPLLISLGQGGQPSWADNYTKTVFKDQLKVMLLMVIDVCLCFGMHYDTMFPSTGF